MPEKYHLIDDICYKIPICDGGGLPANPKALINVQNVKPTFSKRISLICLQEKHLDASIKLNVKVLINILLIKV
jgi:hypothetical protein